MLVIVTALTCSIFRARIFFLIIAITVLKLTVEMSAGGNEIITMEPAQKENQAFKRDENGEEILMEGRHAKRCIIVTSLHPCAMLFGLFVLMPIALCIVCYSARRWRLYLTPNGIRYSHHIGCCCCCKPDHYYFPLDDIDDVLYTPRGKQVIMCMEPMKAKRIVGKKTEFFQIEEVKNGKQFYQAVRRAMAAREREAQ